MLSLSKHCTSSSANTSKEKQPFDKLRASGVLRNLDKSSPILLFDSGVGGLTVYDALRAVLAKPA